jgi:WASH complex subunit 7
MFPLPHPPALPADEQLENLQRFVTDVSSKLQDIQSELDPHAGAHGDAQDVTGFVSVPTERVPLRKLVRTENFVFDKIMAALGTVLAEMRELSRTAEAEFYGPLSMFGEEPGDADLEAEEALGGGDGGGDIDVDGGGGGGLGHEEGELALSVSRILPLLRRLSFFLNRAYALVRNVVQQLASLYNEREKLYVSSFRHVRMTYVFEELGWFFVTLVTLDEIISRNIALTNAWAAFKRMLRSVKLDPTRYGTDEERLRKFEKLLLALEGELLDGLVFQNCVEQDFDVPSIVSVRNNGTFKAEFYHCLRLYFDAWGARLAGPHETDERREFVGITGLYVLHFTLYRDDKDKKFFKALADMHRRIPIVHLHGATTWEPTDFLAKKLPTMSRLVAAKDVLAATREASRHADATLPTELEHLRLELSTWSVRMASTLPHSTPVRDALNTRISLLVNGVCLAHRISVVLKTAMLLHIALDEPLRRGHVAALRGLGELLKGVEAGLARCAGPVAEALPHACKQVSFGIQRVLLPVQARLRAAKKFDDARLDAMAAISLMSNVLCGAPTADRLTLVRLAFDVANSRGVFRDEEVEELVRLMWKLGIVSGLARGVRRACDTSFLYWSRELVGLFVADIYANPDEAHRLQYVLDFLRDPLPVIATARHAASPARFVAAYEAEIAAHIRREIIAPLCRDIETDLRLHVHSAVHRADTPAPNPRRWTVLGVFYLSFFFFSFELEELTGLQTRPQNDNHPPNKQTNKPL